MDTSRISFGEMVAGASGLALLLFMFFPWYGVKDCSECESGSAWQSFSFVDILLFLVAIIAIGMAVARATGAMPANLPAPPGLIVAGAGALAVLLVLFRLVSTPDPTGGLLDDAGIDLTRKIGIFLGLLASAGIAVGGYMATTERASGEAPPAAPPPAPAA